LLAVDPLAVQVLQRDGFDDRLLLGRQQRTARGVWVGDAHLAIQAPVEAALGDVRLDPLAALVLAVDSGGSAEPSFALVCPHPRDRLLVLRGL